MWLYTTGEMNIKKLAIIIALKRRNKNSCFRKKANHIIAGELGISAYLFSKLIKELISDGFIVEQGNYYRIVRFKAITSEFYYKKDLCLGRLNILKSKSLNYHQILKELYSQLIITSLIGKKKHLLSLNIQTEAKTSRVDEIINSLDITLKTSARTVARILSVSLDKANKILNQSELFCRKIVEEWVDGIFEGKLELLQHHFKGARVIPHPERNKYKICFGSVLLPRII